MFLKPESNFKDLHLEAFRIAASYIELSLGENIPAKTLYESLSDRLPYYFNLVNMKYNLACDLCGLKHNNNCSVPYNDDLMDNVL